MRVQSSFVLLPICISGALSNFLGPVYPAPRDLSSRNSLVAAGWRTLTATLEATLNGSSNKTSPALSGLGNMTFSIGMFSTHDSGAETLQFHHTSPEVAHSPVGTNTVDADSIYRVASLTKLFTVLAGLLEMESSDWDRPLSEIFPPLVDFLDDELSKKHSPVYDAQWDQITPSALAAQIAGVSHSGAPWFVDLLALHLLDQAQNISSPLDDPDTYALPPVDLNDPSVTTPCLRPNVTCSAIPYTEGVAANPPIFLPWTSPAYANNGFVLLGLAIANLTGKPVEQIWKESIFGPLNMASSSSQVPPQSETNRSVIAGNPANNWAIAGGLSTPSGGIFSTLNDLAKFGVSILNSTLLPAHETRKWMKPVTHTSDLHYSVGRPWEIYRYTHPATGVVTDIYTKLGDSGYYGSIMAFLPEFNAGFTVLEASSQDSRSILALNLIEQIVDTIVPALFDQAAAELEQNYAGTYAAPADGLNSSITFSASKHGPPGLKVTSWVSNGTDLMPLVPVIMQSENYRLRPTIATPGETGQIAFRAAMVPQNSVHENAQVSGLFADFYSINQWVLLDSVTYNNIALPFFVFDITSEDGSPSAVTPAAWKVKLQKTG
ncbi:hypothetical protein ARAM_002138 [Aspergillus rambellii]|uniref:Uncharacterized protein n=3 Tax=Aspergillus subgen. Nidulantes TaxID=2720870 RepID=A0A0F8XHZ3_9EURO|nr:hypothetical protein AOCH_004276 [Aspergillus ochraceoroseus]KKK23187.1 hypothetical protein ARAM_002138 [Aspergillus rambellii]